VCAYASLSAVVGRKSDGTCFYVFLTEKCAVTSASHRTVIDIVTKNDQNWGTAYCAEAS